MKFKIPEPKIPSDKEMSIHARRWFSNFYGIKFSDWNETLLKHTYPITYFKLTEDEINFLLEEKELDLADQNYKDLEWRILCANPYARSFVKLVSRSPKDIITNKNNTVKPLIKISEIVSYLKYSMRCFEDLVLLKYLNLDYNLVFRPFEKIDPKHEWRCFIKDGKIIGISQYFYNDTFKYSDKYINSVKSRIEKFLNEIAIPNFIVNTFVIDLVVANNEITIIEANPYVISDPCLFKSYENLEECKETFLFLK